MSIQWYPGHMHKASKAIQETLTQVDLVIEVLDARIPFSSENPMIGNLRGNKPCIKVLTKSDLADPMITQQWQAYFEQEQGVKTQAVTTEQPEKIRRLTELCRKLGGEKNIVHALIMGIPNVGKSTLINILAGKSIAKTGNEPAVTKSQQRINLANNIVLSDTPGILWPKIENENSGYRLATTGAIKDTAIDADEVAFFAAETLLKRYSNMLMARYGLDTLPTTEWDFFEWIGRKRGCLKSGGQVDLQRICHLFLTELRAGTIGQISLETPEIVQQELKLLAAQKLQQQAQDSQKTKKEAKKGAKREAPKGASHQNGRKNHKGHAQKKRRR